MYKEFCGSDVLVRLLVDFNLLHAVSILAGSLLFTSKMFPVFKKRHVR